MKRREFIRTATGLAFPALSGLAQLPMTLSDPAFLGRRRSSSSACGVTLATYTGGGDTFDCYTDGDAITNTLSGGTAFSSNWILPGNYTGILGEETFETYAVGSTVTGLNALYGFSAAWNVQPSYTGYGGAGSGEATFDLETDGNVISAGQLTLGTGWTGAWVILVYLTAPVISPTPTAGDTFPKSVTITSAENGDIYYTTDGTTPTNSSTLYTGTISLPSTATVKAIVYKTGCVTSAVSQATYPATAGDLVAASWSSRVVTNGGAAPANSSVLAIATFWNALVTAGINSKMKSVLCYAPDSLTAAITPIYEGSLLGNDPWTLVGFVSGDLTVNGLAGGSGKYLRTGLIPSVYTASANSAGITIYSVTASNGLSVCEMGAQSAVGTEFCFYFSYTGTTYFDCWSQSTAQGRISAANSLFTGMICANRTGSNNSAIYRGNSSAGFNTLVTNAAAGAIGTRPSVELWAHTMNSGGASNIPSSRRISFIAIHDGLTSTEAQALYNAIQALRTSFGGGYV